MTPGVLVAGNNEDADGGDGDADAAEAPAAKVEGSGSAATAKTTVREKPSVSVDDQLTKALELLKAKAA